MGSGTRWKRVGAERLVVRIHPLPPWKVPGNGAQLVSKARVPLNRERFDSSTFRQILESSDVWTSAGLENRSGLKGLGFDSSALRQV